MPTTRVVRWQMSEAAWSVMSICSAADLIARISGDLAPPNRTRPPAWTPEQHLSTRRADDVFHPVEAFETRSSVISMTTSGSFSRLPRTTAAIFGRTDVAFIFILHKAVALFHCTS